MIGRIAIPVLAALAVPAAGAGQESRPAPTVAGVLERLATGGSREELRRAEDDAVKLLRQVYGPVPQAEIEAFANALADLALNGSGGSWALRRAATRPGLWVDGIGYIDADDVEGQPAPAAFDALVRIYETHAARALAGGGSEPFLEAARSGVDEDYELYAFLREVFIADLAPDGRGWRYVLDLFERSDPPCKSETYVQTDTPPGYRVVNDEVPGCTTGRGSRWCAAGELLHRGSLGRTRPWPGPDPDRYRRLCDGSKPWNWGYLPGGG